MTLLRTKRLPLRREVDADGHAVCRPTFAAWEVTLRCDQHCQFCGRRAGHPRTDELTTNECVDVVRELAATGVRDVALHGGEAYLRHEWLHIVKAITDHGMDSKILAQLMRSAECLRVPPDLAAVVVA